MNDHLASIDLTGKINRVMLNLDEDIIPENHHLGFFQLENENFELSCEVKYINDKKEFSYTFPLNYIKHKTLGVTFAILSFGKILTFLEKFFVFIE